MTKKKQAKFEPVRRSRQVTVDEDAVDALAAAFEEMSSGQALRLDAWLEEYGMSQEQFDAHLKHLGESIGRDMGIL